MSVPDQNDEQGYGLASAHADTLGRLA